VREKIGLIFAGRRRVVRHHGYVVRRGDPASLVKHALTRTQIERPRKYVGQKQHVHPAGLSMSTRH
jgi:hypothetical protein